MCVGRNIHPVTRPHTAHCGLWAAVYYRHLGRPQCIGDRDHALVEVLLESVDHLPTMRTLHKGGTVPTSVNFPLVRTKRDPVRVQCEDITSCRKVTTQ